MASYDSKTNQAYVLDHGEYFITAATDAHSAMNNILSAKNYTVKNGMTEEGNSEFVQKINLDNKIYKTAVTGNELKNLFDDCTLNDATYLSRSNWQILDSYDRNSWLGGVSYTTSTRELGTNNSSNEYSATTDLKGTVGIHEASSKIIQGLTKTGWEYSGNPIGINDSSWKKVSYNSKSTAYTLKDMVGVDYNDPKWDDIVNQMSRDEQINIVGLAGWGTDAVESVEKPKTYYMDGPQGMINYIDPSNPGYQFTDQNVLGATWNKELAKKQGDAISKEFVEKGASAWWAPGMNLHRSAYSGRNFEYFSEDTAHVSLLSLAEAKAAQDNGVATFLKHFFMNDQETNRGANGRVAVFATEQTMREIYAKPFQVCIEQMNSLGIMSSMARIGLLCAPCNYATNVSLLRDEWGFKGCVLTDSQRLNEEEAEMGLAAGCDMVLTTSATKYNDSTLASAGGQYMLHNAAKNILYLTTNTIAVDSSIGAEGLPVYVLLLIILDCVVALYLLYGTGEILLKVYPDKIKLNNKTKWIIRGTLWGIAAVLLIVLMIIFFKEWLPDLIMALQNYK